MNIKNYRQSWLTAQRKCKLSLETINMAKRLGLDPTKFTGLNHFQQTKWQELLTIFIRRMYQKKFGK